MIAPGLRHSLDHELNRTADSCDLVTQSDSVGLSQPLDRHPPLSPGANLMLALRCSALRILPTHVVKQRRARYPSAPRLGELRIAKSQPQSAIFRRCALGSKQPGPCVGVMTARGLKKVLFGKCRGVDNRIGTRCRVDLAEKFGVA